MKPGATSGGWRISSIGHIRALRLERRRPVSGCQIRTLRNKLGITDSDALNYTEREIVTQRAAEGIPTGRFDLRHLCAIHYHLFQDIYDWAGQIRVVEISKGGSQFQFRRSIEAGMADVHRRLVAARYLRGLAPRDFADAAGVIMGDVNYVHPFRDGNGRTQLFYLEQLAMRAGHRLALARIDPDAWLLGSRESHAGRYGVMAAEILRLIDPA